MKQLCLLAFVIAIVGCGERSSESSKVTDKNGGFNAFIDNYYHQRMEIFPIESTNNGETRFNDELYPSFTDSYTAKIHEFYLKTLDTLHSFDREKLNENEKISYDYMNEYVTLLDKELSFHSNWIPTDQIWFPLPSNFITRSLG